MYAAFVPVMVAKTTPTLSDVSGFGFDPGTRLTDREAAWMREENERRAADLLAKLRTFDLGPVLITTSDRNDIFHAFLEWADERIVSRGQWW